MDLIDLKPLKKSVRKTEFERTREKHIRENMWKAAHVARKVSGFSGLSFEELRSVALEAMVKLYDKWNPEKANFSTWLNRSLMFQVLNYLRDQSRIIKLPRTYSDVYLKIRRIIGENPDISDEEVEKLTGISARLIRETRDAHQVTYLEINEDTEMPYDSILDSEDSIEKLLTDYGNVLKRLADLPEEDYNFLLDIYVNKRANSTIFRKYRGVNSPLQINDRTKEILSEIFIDKEDEELCQQEDT